MNFCKVYKLSGLYNFEATHTVTLMKHQTNKEKIALLAGRAPHHQTTAAVTELSIYMGVFKRLADMENQSESTIKRINMSHMCFPLKAPSSLSFQICT